MNPKMLSLYQYEHLPFNKRRIAARFFAEASMLAIRLKGSKLDAELDRLISQRNSAI